MSDEHKTEADKLLPCPFCGGTHIEIIEKYENPAAPYSGRLRCMKCGCEQAKPKWNDRIQSQADEITRLTQEQS